MFCLRDDRIDSWTKNPKNWCVPFGTQRVEAEGMSKNEQRH